MGEYRVLIRVKNNLLHQQMISKNIQSQSELSRVTGVCQQTIGKIANLKIGAFNANGQPSSATLKLCEYFGCLPEDIYPKEVLHVGIPSNVIERIVSSEQVANYLESQKLDPLYELEEKIDLKFILSELDRLSPRKRKIVEMIYLEEKTLREVAEFFNISRERARSIANESIMKLKEIARTYGNEDESIAHEGASGMSAYLTDAILEKQKRTARDKNEPITKTI